jgi:transposase
MNVTRHVYNAAIDVFRLDRKANPFTVRDNLKYGQFAKMIEEYTFPIEAFTQAVCEARRTVKGGGKIKRRECNDLTSTMYSDGIRDGVIYPINMTRELRKVIPLDANISRTAALKAQKKTIDDMIKASKVNHGTDRRLCTVTFNRRCGKFTVHIPTEEDRLPSYQPKLDEVVAVDPGVRTIATFYSEHYHGYLGEDWYRRTMHLEEKADLLAKQAKQCGKFYTKYRLRKRAALINQKVTNRITNMQHQTASFLAKNFQVILLPDMEVSKMIRAEKVSPSVSRVISLSSQYRFRQIMLQKAEKYSANVILCKEYYTSRTCTRCGSIKNDLGSSKTYQCAKCGLCVDRDYNGARNIMLKHLTLRGDGPSTDSKKPVRSRLSLKKGKSAP